MGVGERAADPIEADAPRHLLDQVDLTVEVGAERRHDRNDGVAVATASLVFGGSVELDAQRRQRVPDVFRIERGAEHRVHVRRTQGDALTLDGTRVHVDRVGCDLRVGHLHEELHRPLGTAGDRVGIDAALEARTRLAAQLESLRGERDAHALEVGRLEQDLGGGVGHLRGGTAHDAGDGLRHPLGVADEQILRGELALDAVEGGDRLPRRRGARTTMPRPPSFARSNVCSGWLRSSST